MLPPPELSDPSDLLGLRRREVDPYFLEIRNTLFNLPFTLNHRNMSNFGYTSIDSMNKTATLIVDDHSLALVMAPNTTIACYMRGLEGDVCGGCFNYSSYTPTQTPQVRLGTGPVAIAVASSSKFAFMFYRSPGGGGGSAEAFNSCRFPLNPSSVLQITTHPANSTIRITSIASKVAPDESRETSLCVELGSLNGFRKSFCQLLPLQSNETGFSSSNVTTSVDLVILPDSKTACAVSSTPNVIIECRAIGSVSIFRHQQSTIGAVSKMSMTRSGALIGVASYNNTLFTGDFFYYTTTTKSTISLASIFNLTKTDSIFTLDDKYVRNHHNKFVALDYVHFQILV